jgi:hypothetical protein
MRCELLAGGPVEVCSQPVELYAWSTSERRHCRLGTDESMPTQWGKLADWNPIPGHNEGFALVQLAHNLAAVIAQLTLGDLSGHLRTVAQVLHRGVCPRRSLPWSAGVQACVTALLRNTAKRERGNRSSAVNDACDRRRAVIVSSFDDEAPAPVIIRSAAQGVSDLIRARRNAQICALRGRSYACDRLQCARFR